MLYYNLQYLPPLALPKPAEASPSLPPPEDPIDGLFAISARTATTSVTLFVAAYASYLHLLRNSKHSLVVIVVLHFLREICYCTIVNFLLFLLGGSHSQWECACISHARPTLGSHFTGGVKLGFVNFCLKGSRV